MGRIGGVAVANKRMFSVDVTETDAFLDLSHAAQALYFHLGMRGDDDGFVASPRSTMRAIGCTEKELQELHNSGYIIVFRSGVLVITDWRRNNTLKNDRYHKTPFQDEYSQLDETSTKRYILRAGSILGPNRKRIGDKSEPELNVTKHHIAVVDAAAAGSRSDSDLAKIVQQYEQTIGLFPRSALNKLQSYRDSIPAEVICKAFDEAAESGHRSWKYVNGILKSWQADGVRTLGDVDARRDARKKPKESAGEEWQKMEVLR